jgi:MGT family glycosyltransferase
MAIARALQDAGHEVAVYTGGGAREMFEREGFAVFPFRRVRDGEILLSLMNERVASSSFGALRERAAALREWLVGSLPDQIEDVEDVLDGWLPDVVVSDVTMWAVPLVLKETRRLPVALSLFMPGCTIPGPDAPPWGLGLGKPRGAVTRAAAFAYRMVYDLAAFRFRNAVSSVRRRFGLPPLATDVNTFLGTMPLYLVPSTPEFDYSRRDLPASVRYVGGLSWNKGSDEPPPDWLRELPANRPLVHVTEGTMHVGRPLVLQAAAEGLAGMPLSVVMTSGRDRSPDTLGLGRLADNIRLEQWVAHCDLLPRTDVMVTTGGGSTIVAGMTAGVPMVVVPTLWDKPDNAQRVAESGAGIRLDPRHCTPDKLREAVRRILEEPRFRESAQRHAREFVRLGRPEGVVALLEGLLDARLDRPELGSAAMVTAESMTARSA